MIAENSNHWAVLDMAEQVAPEETINLWPRIEAQIHSSESGKTGASTRKIRVRLAVGLSLFLVGSFFFVPAARAFTADILHQMGIAFVDTDQFSPDTQVGSAERVINSSPLPSLNPDEVRAQIDFPLLLPTWLPEGLDYAYYSLHTYDPQSWGGNGKELDVDFGCAANFDFASGVLRLHANDGPISAPPLLAESREQAAMVNGQPGIYVHGGWQDDGRGDPNTRMGSLQWDDRADDAYLTWSQDGVTYLLEAHNLRISLEELKRIAASMIEYPPAR